MNVSKSNLNFEYSIHLAKHDMCVYTSIYIKPTLERPPSPPLTDKHRWKLDYRKIHLWHKLPRPGRYPIPKNVTLRQLM